MASVLANMAPKHTNMAPIFTSFRGANGVPAAGTRVAAAAPTKECEQRPNEDRLTDADEGELASGSITGRKRREMWKDGSTLKLSQTGNWLQRKLDKNGDGDYTDWEELNDTATFNKANEWLTRDLDSTSGTTGDNYTLTHDADGNLTNDGQSYKYVYDAFGRMVEVKNQSNTTLAKYRYNGLGYRIMWQYDANSNGSLATSERYYFAYDERWRMLATFRDQDSNPKERFVYHAAGMGGFGVPRVWQGEGIELKTGRCHGASSLQHNGEKAPTRRMASHFFHRAPHRMTE